MNATTSFVDSRQRAAYGSCRSRGRQERAHRSLPNAQTRFTHLQVSNVGGNSDEAVMLLE